MGELFAVDMLALDYAQRCQALLVQRIALWDVLQACYRSGSLDSHIDMATAVANDFESFLRQYPKIQRIFFNGAKAEQIFMRLVWPRLAAFHERLLLQRLPSTSPANASISRRDKLLAWRALL